MEELIVGGEYTYTDLMNYASNKWRMKYYGNQDGIIGESFLVIKLLKDLNMEDPPNVCDDAMMSFIMTGYTTQGIFRLIYKYIG